MYKELERLSKLIKSTFISKYERLNTRLNDKKPPKDMGVHYGGVSHPIRIQIVNRREYKSVCLYPRSDLLVWSV